MKKTCVLFGAGADIPFGISGGKSFALKVLGFDAVDMNSAIREYFRSKLPNFEHKTWYPPYEQTTWKEKDIVEAAVKKKLLSTEDKVITFLTDPFGSRRKKHYSRNEYSVNVSEETLKKAGYEPVDESNDKFHQNNKKGDRNRKYVVADWFSFEIVYYSDGTINNTPEDRGTFNVYSGDWWFGKYVIHGVFDVVPYMLWGNEESDSTTIWDRLEMAIQ